jgi:dienelactone hydrolase
MARRHVVLLSPVLAVVSAAAVPPPHVVDLTASGGIVLKATYFAAAQPGPGVLLLHQCNRQRKVWDGLAAQLAAAGIHVLTLDLRGFGESGGAPFDKLSSEENVQARGKWPGDIDLAFEYLASQPGVTRDVIGVGGASCGVDNSIGTARRHPREVKSLVLLSGGTDFAGRRFLRESHQLPAFFAVAQDDEFRETVEVVPWLFSLSSNPGKQFVQYATGGHGADMFAVHPELRGLIVDWYVTTLIKTPGHAPAHKNTVPLPQSAQVLSELEKPGGIDRVARDLAQARRKDPKAVIFSEALVNLMGYEHLQTGDIQNALAIFKLNASAFPGSPNVYDSLADAYLAAGQKDLARQNAGKALELLPGDTTDPETRRQAIRDSAQSKLPQTGEGHP